MSRSHFCQFYGDAILKEGSYYSSKVESLYRCGGVVVRASATQSVDLRFIS